MSSIEQMPTTNDEKMSGTINILIKLMNSEPMGLMYSAWGPRMAPAMTPKGLFGGRNAVVAHRRVAVGEPGRGDRGERAAHAEAHDRGPFQARLEVLQRALHLDLGSPDPIEPLHQVVGLVGHGRHPAVVEVGRGRREPGRREALGHALDLVVQAPPFLDHDDAGARAVHLGQIARRRAAVRAGEGDHGQSDRPRTALGQSR